MNDFRRKNQTEEELAQLILACPHLPQVCEAGDRLRCPGCLKNKPRWIVYQDILACQNCQGRFFVVMAKWPAELIFNDTNRVRCSKCVHSTYKVTGNSLECCYCHQVFKCDHVLRLKPLDFTPKVKVKKQPGGFSRSSIYRALSQLKPTR